MDKEKISFDDFLKLDLRTAKIIEVQNIEGRDKLYKLTIEVGKEKRTLVAGLREYYSPEELQGKTLIIVANLEPKKLGGILSEGMLLAAEENGKVVLLTTDKEIPSGSKIS
ncbi:methionine--tRNA ligase subunit beta [Candidatus Micrarchaeota archaeon]|nr:methionine--tRNA ligase subunit beta [Candidatus Micrarchaeota archaeon]